MKNSRSGLEKILVDLVMNKFEKELKKEIKKNPEQFKQINRSDLDNLESSLNDIFSKSQSDKEGVEKLDS